MNLVYLMMCALNPNVKAISKKFKNPIIEDCNDDFTSIEFRPSIHSKNILIATDTGQGYMIAYESGSQSFIPY